MWLLSAAFGGRGRWWKRMADGGVVMALDTMTGRIDNRSELIDSRDIIFRLEEMREALNAGEVPDAADVAELAALSALEDAGIDGWSDGVALVRENYFVEYIREGFDDMVEPEVREVAARWPFNRIDWERAARDLYPDFTHVLFAGVTYLAR